MAREDPLFGLRIPQDLKDLLANKAGENKRSLTAEVLDRLEKSLQPALLDQATQPQIDLVEEVMRLREHDVLALLELMGEARATGASVASLARERAPTGGAEGEVAELTGLIRALRADQRDALLNLARLLDEKGRQGSHPAARNRFSDPDPQGGTVDSRTRKSGG